MSALSIQMYDRSQDELNKISVRDLRLAEQQMMSLLSLTLTLTLNACVTWKYGCRWRWGSDVRWRSVTNAALHVYARLENRRDRAQ